MNDFKIRYRIVSALLMFLMLAGCGHVDGQSAASSAAAPRGSTSPVPAPTVTGPIEGGLHGVPWGGAVPALAPLAAHDFVQEEYFYSGTAQARDENGALTGAEADYNTRMLVQRPRDPAAFNGTVVLEWVNVSLEAELPVIWLLTHDELLREGYAWVGVSAQITGVSVSPLALKVWDPLRYAPLHHPGDAYEFDIYAQAARALFARNGPAPLGPLQARRVMAAGESQSAALLRTYVNHVDAEQRVVDGVLIHTWPGPIDADARIPVLMLLTESEIDGASSPLGSLRAVSWAGMIGGLDLGDLPGAGPLRVPIAEQPSPDHRHLRVWEVAGASHGDQDLVEAFIAQLSQDLLEPLAPPLTLDLPPGSLPINNLKLARVTSAALHQLDRWMRTGTPPPSMPRVQRRDSGYIDRDEDGFARGGIRLPNYAVPIGLNRGDTLPLVGSYAAFAPAQIRARYPSRDAFLDTFADATAASVDAGALLEPDAQAFLDEAQAVDAWRAP